MVRGAAAHYRRADERERPQAVGGAFQVGRPVRSENGRSRVRPRIPRPGIAVVRRSTARYKHAAERLHLKAANRRCRPSPVFQRGRPKGWFTAEADFDLGFVDRESRPLLGLRFRGQQTLANRLIHAVARRASPALVPRAGSGLEPNRLAKPSQRGPNPRPLAAPGRAARAGRNRAAEQL